MEVFINFVGFLSSRIVPSILKCLKFGEKESI